MFELPPGNRRPRLLAVAAVLVFVLAGLLGRPAHAQTETGLASVDLPYVPGELLIGWEANSQVIPVAISSTGLASDRSSPAWQAVVQTLAAATGLVVLDAQPEYGTARLAVSRGQEAAEMGRLTALPWVRYAELNYIAHAATTYPNDPFFGDQWNLRRIGAPVAWDVTTGSISIVVAVLDSGVDLGHPEFAGRLLSGYDYVNSDAWPQDDFGHGTHVAGILAAAANNATGVAGLAPNIKILPLKVLDASGGGTYANIATAIRRAADSAVQVINLSLGGINNSVTLRDAVTYAVGRNAAVVAAAGNCAKPIGQCSYQTNPNFYPAAFPEVVAVGASDHFDNWADYSGYKSYIALAAPGGASADPVWSTFMGGYGFQYGTSMAAPLVSGAAALALTISPTLSITQVVEALQTTADKTGFNLQTSSALDYTTGRNDYFGAGRLNVGRLARWLSPAAITATPASITFQAQSGGQRTASVVLTNPSVRPINWQATVTEGAAWLSVTPALGSASDVQPGALILRAAPAALAPGYYDGVVHVQYSGAASGNVNLYVLLRVTTSLHALYAPLIPVRHLNAAWLDPLAGGAPLGLADNSTRQLALPFPFYFYGRTYTSLWVSDDGVAFFSQPGAGAISAPGSCLPTAAAPNSAIYALWADWKPALGGQVYVHEPDSDHYAITWYQMRQTAGAVPQSFQVVLFRDGHLTLQYLTVQSPLPGTIGLENYDGTFAEMIWCSGQGRPVSAGSAVNLRPNLPW